MLDLLFGIEGANLNSLSIIRGAVLAPLTLVACLIVSIFCLRKRKGYLYTLLSLLFVFYLSALIEITFFPLPYRSSEIIQARQPLCMLFKEINLIPFKGVWTIFSKGDSLGAAVQVRNWLGNILLFIPLGFSIPILSKRFGDAKKVILSICVISLFIEESQFLLTCFVFRAPYKVTDIDDLIANVLGGLVGFLFFIPVRRTYNCIRGKRAKEMESTL